jgi:hypothetical protein
LLAVSTGGHIVLGRGTCADAVAVAFLGTGRLPTRDRICPGPAAQLPPTAGT